MLKEVVDTLIKKEKQEVFLLKLRDTLHTIYNLEEVQFEVVSILGKYLGVGCSFYCDVDQDGDHLWIHRHYINNMESQTGHYLISDFGLFLLDECLAGQTVVMQDTASDVRLSEKERLTYVTKDVRAFVSVPLVKGDKLLSVLIVNQSTSRKWTEAEISIIEETAERTWAAVERAKVEEDLRNSEVKYRTLFDSTDEGLSIMEVLFDDTGKAVDYIFLEMNGAHKAMTGVSHAGMHLRELMPDIEESVLERIGKVVLTGEGIRYEQYISGLDRWFDIYTSRIGGNGSRKVANVFNNITQRKQAEEKIRENEDRFRTMADASPVLIWTIDANGLSSYYNKTFLDFIGVSKNEDISDWGKIVHPDDIKSTFDTISRAIAERRSYSLECRLLRSDGHWRWILAQGNPLVGVTNEFTGFTGSSVDITEQKEAEAKIKESENHFRNLIEESTVAVAVLEGPEWVLTLVNNQMLEIWQRDSSINGKKLLDFMPELIGQPFPKLLKAVYETGVTYSDEDALVVLNRSGKLEDVYMDFSYKALRNSNGEVYATLVAAADVTERYKIKRQLEESEQRFKNLVRDATTAIVVLTGPEMKVEIVNEAYGRLIELKPDDLLGKPLFNIIPEATEYYLPLLENVRQTGEMLQLFDSPYVVTVNGKCIEGFLHVVYQPYRDADGKILGVMAIMQDVTQSVLNRKKIEQSEKKFEAAILAVAGIIWTNNADGKMIGEQLGWAKLTGQRFEEYQGYGWTKAIHPDDVHSTVKAWNNAVANGSTFEFVHRLKTKQDGWRVFSVKAVPSFDQNGAIQQWVGVHTDITEQTEAEQKIKESEERFRSLADESPMFVYIINPDPKASVIYNNKTMLSYMGQTAEQANGKAWNEIMHPEDAPVALESYILALTARKPYYIPAARVMRFDGEYRWHSFQGNLRCLPNGEFNGYIGVGIDIHEQKLAEEKIKESEERFRLLADSMPQHIWTSDTIGNLNYYNQSVFDYSGLTFEQINKDGWMQIVHPDDRETNIKEWINAVTTGKDFLLEHRFRRHDGEYRWHLSRAILQKDENGKIQMWVGTSTNIHEQKTFVNELERQVHNRTKELALSNIELKKMNKELESFAYISSHDLQEPLRKIQTFASYLLEKEVNNLSEIGKDYFDRIYKAAQRMQTLIQDLLAYSRTNSIERKFETTNLNEIIAEIKDALKEDLKEKNATIEANQLCNADIIPFQFRQLIHNLIVNSLKFSIPENPPYIRIKCEIAKGIAFSNVRLLPQSKYCHITVSDNGIGFKQEHSEKIFELFQRLHGRNEYDGTGIGLSIVKRIVENHNGIIIANGELNKGATFDIYIPTT